MKRLPFLFEVFLLCLLVSPVVGDKFGKHKLAAKSEPVKAKPSPTPSSARTRIAVKNSTTEKSAPKTPANRKVASKKTSVKSVRKTVLNSDPAVIAPLPKFTGTAMEEFAYRLQAEGRNLRLHGVYVERWDNRQAIAQLNENAVFNPASVIKLATTLAALDRLGPQHRFRTEFRAAGHINPQIGELAGNLILVSGGDPSFSIRDAQAAGDALRAMGIRKVTGNLIVVGNFVCNENSRTDVSAGVFRRQSKIAFHGQTQFVSTASELQQMPLLLTVESDSLLNIARYLNAHSSNAMADMLAQHVGGPTGIRSFLVVKLGLPYEATYISHGSGLDVNRLTPRDTVKVLRALVDRLHSHRLRLETILPIAGLDSGTLTGRFAETEFIGSVLAKTGTLHDTDDGVAALAGVMNTRQCGALLFAVYDMAEGRRVLHLRRVQDDLLKRLMNECGGPVPLALRSESDTLFRPQSRLVMN